MYKKISFSALAISAMLVMNGCGGGGSTESVSDGSVPVSSQAISGVAVDDLILNGVVEAKDPSGNLLASGRTSDSDGRYTVNVNYTGVVLLNVTCDGNSKMYNPDTKIETACDADVSLNSLGSVTAGNDLTLNISPLTEIVYQRAEFLAGGNISNVDTSDVEDARIEIGLMFSVDPLSEDPTVDTYADIIGTIHTLADADPDASVIDITNLLAEELADGEADGTADETLSALVEVMADENLTNNLVDTNGTYIPPENPADLSDIDEAKALFTDLRTQAMSITDYTNSGTPGFLDVEALSMEQALNGVVMDVSLMSNILGELNGAIKYAIDSNQTSEARIIYNTNYAIIVTKNTITSWDYQIGELNANTPEWGGSVSYPDFDTNDIFNFTTLTANVSGDMPLGYTTVTDPNIVDSQSFNGSITTNKTTDGATFEIAGVIASNGTSVTLSNMIGEIAYDENTTTGEPILNYIKLNGLALQGIVGGYTIDGSVTVNSYVQNTGLADKGGIYEESVGYFGVMVGCPTSAVADANLSLIYDGVTYQADSVNKSYEYMYEFYNLPIDTTNTNILSNIVYSAVCVDNADTAYINLAWNSSDSYMNIANSGWLPNDITFTGAISRTGASIEGTLNAKWLNATTFDMENSLDVPLVDVTLNGKLQMPESPAMLFTLSFENSTTHYTLGASYTYDATVINMSALFDTEMNNGDVVITTHTGLNADINIIDDGITTAVTGTITKDGALLGALEERFDVPVVKYIDGSFESLP